ncbi:MAG TPA: hypothetical protein VHZ07_24520 [Bryobacteraceae bacterium]|jgi:hypothetical protein|nr:hypothetical protein [Bryobacteraceae bacterium]
MRGSGFFTFALLLATCQPSAAQDVVSASSGVLQYFEGAVSLDNLPVEHKAAVFPSLKNGSTLRTAKGRAELLLTPGVYLRADEDTSLRMVSNSLTDTRLEVTEGAVILDNVNASSHGAITLVVDESEIRFPNPGVYRIDCNFSELQVYSGEAEVKRRGTTSTIDSSHLYYFLLGITTDKFGDGAMDEFYDWARNRSDVIANQNEVALADQDDAQDPDPSGIGGMFVVPPIYSSPGYSMPTTSVLGYSIYGSGIDPFYLYSPTQFLGFADYPGIIVVAPRRYGFAGSKWPRTPGLGYRPRIGTGLWPTPAQGLLAHPLSMPRYPIGGSAMRPSVTTVPHMTPLYSMPRTYIAPHAYTTPHTYGAPHAYTAPHIAAPHAAIGGRR